MKQKNVKKKPSRPSKPSKPVYDVPEDWWYLIPEEVSLRTLWELCRDTEQLRAEFWEEAGVLELEVQGAGSLDLEEWTCDLGDEAGNAFLEQHGIRTVFAAGIRRDAYGELKPMMELLTEKAGGFFCGDTDDFTPVVGKL